MHSDEKKARAADLCGEDRRRGATAFKVPNL